jgi:uncharacterized SAM-binding protein YcdF (DUF218 family)
LLLKEVRHLFYLIKFLYTTFLLPPGIYIFILAILCGKFYKKHRKVALVLTAFTLVLYLSSTVWFSNTLIRSLEKKHRPPAEVKGDIIIMLGGGATLDTPNVNGRGNLSGPAANRLLTCLQLYHKLKVPIIVSGGQVFKATGCEAEITRKILLGVGVPADKILVENRSKSTVENARFVKKILGKYKFHNPILVTSAFHMERSIRAFTKSGLRVVPYPSDYHTNVSSRFGWGKLVPSAAALSDVSLAVKEYLGIAVSRWY